MVEGCGDGRERLVQRLWLSGGLVAGLVLFFHTGVEFGQSLLRLGVVGVKAQCLYETTPGLGPSPLPK